MDVEEATFLAFIRKSRDQRYIALLRKSRKRKLIEKLHQVDNDFDDRFVFTVRAEDEQPKRVYDRLRELGAPGTCHVISTIDHLDGQEMDLRDALAEAFNSGEKTLISCIPGELAYFEGDYRIHWILHRPPHWRSSCFMALDFIPQHPKIPDDAFMVKRLSGYSPDLAGRIVYPAAFDALGY